MRRGDICVIDATDDRLGVIVSNDAANDSAERLGRGILTVVPMTANTSRVFDFQVFVPARASGLSKRTKAQAEQVCSVSVDRIGERRGRLSAELLSQVDQALRIHLGL